MKNSGALKQSIFKFLWIKIQTNVKKSPNVDVEEAEILSAAASALF